MQYQKTAEGTNDLIGNEITKVSQNSQQNSSETVTNKHEYLKRDIYSQKKDRKLLII